MTPDAQAAPAGDPWNSLLAALLAVQQEAPTLPKDATNPHYKSSYTPLDTIVKTIGPILNKHGLVWITKPGSDEHGRPVLNYTLAHAPSGEREDGSMPLLLSKEDAQGMGSAITYARRYSLCTVLNLVADDDDDGHAASTRPAAAAAPSEASAELKQTTRNALHYLLDGDPRATGNALTALSTFFDEHLPAAAGQAVVIVAKAVKAQRQAANEDLPFDPDIPVDDPGAPTDLPETGS